MSTASLSSSPQRTEESTQRRCVCSTQSGLWLPLLTLHISGWVWTAAYCNFGTAALGTCWKQQQHLFGAAAPPLDHTGKPSTSILDKWGYKVDIQVHLLLRLFVCLNCNRFYKSYTCSTKRNLKSNTHIPPNKGKVDFIYRKDIFKRLFLLTTD